jgi:hypothetical protein
MGDNAFELNIPPFLGLHPVFNMDLLHPYFPPLLDTSEVVEQLTPIELNPTTYNRHPMIILCIDRSRALDNKGSSFIESSKQGSSCTKASGSPGAKFSRNFLILWGTSTQWRPFLPKEGGLIQMDIGGHPPFPTGSK